MSDGRSLRKASEFVYELWLASGVRGIDKVEVIRRGPYGFSLMCGIAGYSLSPDSSVDRTLAAQALLAGIADRGADAVGYAYRAPGEAFSTVVKQRTPAVVVGATGLFRRVRRAG